MPQIIYNDNEQLPIDFGRIPDKNEPYVYVPVLKPIKEPARIRIKAECSVFSINRECFEFEAVYLLENIRDLFLEFQKAHPFYGTLKVTTEKI